MNKTKSQKPETPLKYKRLKPMFSGKKTLLIVLQDFPDPDAIAAAASLKEIAKKLADISCSVACSGFVGRSENRALVNYLGMNLLSVDKLNLESFDLIAMVDTQPATGNNSLSGDVIPQIIIDHHPIRSFTRKAEFYDIRSRYGATSTILYEYLEAAGIVPDKQLATALVYGIRSDTNDLGRDTIQADVRAFLALYPMSNKNKLGKIETARLPREYFTVLYKAVKNAKTYGRCVISNLGEIHNPDMIGEVADLLLRNEESEWAMCHGLFGGQALVSLRTSERDGNAGAVVNRVVGRKGSSGGHRAMAGGQIPLKTRSAKEAAQITQLIKERFLKACKCSGEEGEALVQKRYQTKVPD